MRSPETGIWETVYDEKDILEIRDAIATRGQSPQKKGQTFIRRETLMKSLKTSLRMVHLLESKGILHRETRPRARGRPEIWYPRTEFNQASQLVSELRKGIHSVGAIVCLTPTAAVGKYGWDYKTLSGWEVACPCLADGKLSPAWPTDPLTDRLVKCYREPDLDAIKEAQSRGFSGVIDTPKGRLLTLTHVSKLTGLAKGRLRRYSRDGRLPAKLRRRPDGRKGRHLYMVIEADAKRLKQEIDAAVDANDLGNWQTVYRVCLQHRIPGRFARLQVFKLLQQARDAGVLSGVERAVRFPKTGRVCKRVLFDTEEVDNLLAGRSLADVAEEFFSVTAGGVPAGEAIADIRRKGQRGRNPKPQTQSLYEFCYGEYITKDQSRSTVMRLANADPRFGPNAIGEESDVRRYAKRFAQPRGLPMPPKSKPARGGTK
jgi:hypothetical protein